MADSDQNPAVDDIVRLVLKELDDAKSGSPEQSDTGATTAVCEPDDSCCLFSSLDDAVESARMAQRKFLDLSMERRGHIVETIRGRALESAERLGQLAVDETGLGKMPDKKNKIILCARKTPGPEDLKPEAFSGDNGLTLVEPAPWGVVGSITPSTNPPSTVLNNAISIISAGNAAVFNPHPSAKNVSGQMARLVHDAIVEAGGPENLVTCISQPTIESAQALWSHKHIDLVLVTGGGAVVKAAMVSGKRAICAGPGNPPVVVDETAILPHAGQCIVTGASFDNNVLCTDEKEIFVVDKVAHRLKREMIANGAFELDGIAIDKLTNLLVERDPDGQGYRHVGINRNFVGKPPDEILKQIDVVPPPGTKLVFFEAPWDHPLVMAEQLMPVIPMVRCKTVEEAMEKAVIVEHQYKHTFVMHSTSIVNLSNMAQLCRANIFVKNGFNMAGLGYGGEGFASMSIAGTTGEGITKASTFTRPRRCTLVDYFRIV
ncbi:MAG: aldehyde dehydrogenase EutE [candidate division Zixibacteria bacterium]|nr:aldehyde dehydrogenase EutE [candidate division Zixibacteria bacterium]MDH3939203.1 aldehyde dehydrogenase EutE [candidate division Zixibacteria bacterium]MDH4034246.1 aldehyde dehydrogenase EutE [candidate division Zixibacteria bacterium]